MKLATFDSGAGQHIGAVVGDALVDLTAAGLPASMIALIADWAQLAGKVRELVENAKPEVKLSQVHLCAPVPNPQKVLAIGLNYADHIAETNAQKPEQQIWFSKLPNSVNGPFDPIELPKASNMVDYEAELVVVIGKRCRHVSKADAPRVIFGFTVGNDVSVRDWQKRTPQWILGKSFDTHAPVGPWIVTPDELGDPHTLGIRCFVNGETRQNSNTKNLVFNVYDQIELLSQALTLVPGDMIFTGTPGGVGMAMKPPSYLKAGDVVRIEIDRIGGIEATMQPER
jgi:ureidoglycolate lyase